MPGLHLYIGPDPARELARRRTALERLHRPRHESFVERRQGPTYALWSTAYDQYPITVESGNGVDIAVEGVFAAGEKYPTLRDEITAILDKAVQGGGNIGALRAGRGDFFVLGLDPARGLWLAATDGLGRLPVYVDQNGSSVTLTRDYALQCYLSESPRIDRQALADQLHFGFPGGDSTLLEQITLLPVGAIMVGRLDRPEILLRASYPPSYDPRLQQTQHAPSDADLAEWFVGACSGYITSGRTTVVALSGGFDSRLVAAGLQKAGSTPYGRTFGRQSEGGKREVAIAREAARTLELDWRSVPLTAATARDILEVIHCKAGLNSVRSAAEQQFLRALDAEFGSRMAFFSGDGGNLVLADLYPPQRSRSGGDLVDQIFLRQGLMPADIAARAAGTAVEDYRQAWTGSVEQCPEQTAAGRYVAFVLRQHARRSSYEAEDLNRFFFWTVAPFYHAEFVERFIRDFTDAKDGYALYARLANALDPRLLELPNASRGYRMRSTAMQLRHLIARVTVPYPSAYARVRRIARRTCAVGPSDDVYQLILELTDAASPLAGICELEYLRRYLTTGRCFAEAAMNIATTLLALEWIVTKRSRLEDNPDRVLDIA